MTTKSNDTNDFLKNGPWDELYALSTHWKSDLKFYKDDLRFLHHLIDKYIIWITKKENLDLVKEVQHSLFDIKRSCGDLLEKFDRHIVRLGRLVENPNQSDAAVVKMEHEHLETEIARFVQLFRSNRKKVFNITEYIVDSEELTNVIGR